MIHSREIRLLLVDDHAVVRMGLASVLEAAADDFKVVGQSEGGECVVELFLKLLPDVVLLDIRMPRISGIETLGNLRAVFPDARVLMLSTSCLEEDFAQAFEGGAMGYVVKTARTEELVDAIRTVAAGGRYVPVMVEARLRERSQRKAFTPREAEVIELLGRGFTNREVGEAMGVTENTAKTHVKAVLTKLEAADRAEAVANAFGYGLLRVKDET